MSTPENTNKAPIDWQDRYDKLVKNDPNFQAIAQDIDEESNTIAQLSQQQREQFTGTLEIILIEDTQQAPQAIFPLEETSGILLKDDQFLDVYGVATTSIDNVIAQGHEFLHKMDNQDVITIYTQGDLEREGQLHFLAELDDILKESITENSEREIELGETLKTITLAFQNIFQTIQSFHQNMREATEEESHLIAQNIETIVQQSNSILAQILDTKSGLQAIKAYENYGNLKQLTEDMKQVIINHVSTMQDLKKLRLIMLIEDISQMASYIFENQENVTIPFTPNDIKQINQSIQQLFDVSKIVLGSLYSKENNGFKLIGENPEETNLYIQNSLDAEQAKTLDIKVSTTSGITDYINAIKAVLVTIQSKIKRHKIQLQKDLKEVIKNHVELIDGSQSISPDILLKPEIIETSITFLQLFNIDARKLTKDIEDGVRERKIKVPQDALEYLQFVQPVEDLIAVAEFTKIQHNTELTDAMKESIRKRQITQHIFDFQTMFAQWYATELLLIEFKKSEIEKINYEFLMKEIEELNKELQKKLAKAIKDITRKHKKVYTADEIENFATNKFQTDITNINHKGEQARHMRKSLIRTEPKFGKSQSEIHTEVGRIFRRIYDITDPKKQLLEQTHAQFLAKVRDCDPTWPATKRRLEAAKLGGTTPSVPPKNLDQQVLEQQQTIDQLQTKIGSLEIKIAEMERKFQAFINTTEENNS